MSFQLKWWGKRYTLTRSPVVSVLLEQLSCGPPRRAALLADAAQVNLRTVQRILQTFRAQGLAECEEVWFRRGSQRVWYGTCSAALRRRIQAQTSKLGKVKTGKRRNVETSK